LGSPAQSASRTSSGRRSTFTGHFTSTFQGHAGKSQTVDFIATDILRVQHGAITDNWHLEDNLHARRQGVVPPPVSFAV
jgi:hypothetical protein